MLRIIINNDIVAITFKELGRVYKFRSGKHNISPPLRAIQV